MPKLNILHAGALRMPITQGVKLLQRRYPDLEVNLEAHGSRACAWLVREGRPVDIIALADHYLFSELLEPEFVDRYFIFANDQIVLAYNEFAHAGAEVNADNWFEILQRSDVTFGRSNHNLDPCGYRTLMCWQLAEKYYRRPRLFQKLDQKCTAKYIYPKSYDVAADVLEGRLDYGFEYLCVAKQFGLKYIILPEEINLSSSAYAAYYQQAKVSLQGKNSGEMIVISGAPIEFAIAIPKNAPNVKTANAFLELMLSKKGQRLLEQCGLIPY